ncbi:IS1634 family transposase [Methanospirillum sp.]
MSRRHTSASKRTAKPAQVTRTKQSFDDQLRRISDEKDDNSLIIPFSLLVIASYLNRLHFKEIINERLRWDPAQWKYSPGVLAQIMVLSVFVPSRKKVALSRIHEAFAGIDLTYLVGEKIDPETLNDDLFGQLLDRMYEYGCSTLYRSISLTVRTTFDLPQNYFLHSDTTSHVLTGEYECSQSQEISTVIKPTYGVSKEKRADLKQIMSGSVTDGDGLVLFCHILDGNTADCEYNNLMISTLQSVYGDEFGEYTYIADCKVLTEKNLKLIYKGVKSGNPVKIISCLPDNFGGKLSEKMRKIAYLENNWETLGVCCQYPSGNNSEPEYWSRTYQKDVFGHPMWVHVYRKKEAEKHLERYLNDERRKFETDLDVLTSKVFMCEPDARTELENFIKKHKKSIFSAELSLGSTTKEKRPVGRPSKIPKPSVIETTWSFSAGEIRGDEEKIERKRRKIDSFCLLTSISPEEMNSREVLLNYKRQNVVESMFSLLKEPLLASTIFLEKPERIEVLMTILYFSVLMHGILQLITRNRIEKLPKVPKIGPENRPLLRPKSGTVLNILENFEIVTVDGVLKKIRSKQKKRSKQLDLIMYLVDFDPAVI